MFDFIGYLITLSLLGLIVLITRLIVKSTERKDKGQEENHFIVRQLILFKIFSVIAVLIFGALIILSFVLFATDFFSSGWEERKTMLICFLFIAALFALCLYNCIKSLKFRIVVNGRMLEYRPPFGHERQFSIDDIAFYTSRNTKVSVFDHSKRKMFTIENGCRNLGEFIGWMRRGDIKYDFSKSHSNPFILFGRKKRQQYFPVDNGPELEIDKETGMVYLTGPNTRPLPENLEELIEKAAMDCLNIKANTSGSHCPTACSKIGGKPDLPPDFQWDYYEGKNHKNETANRPLAFLLQLNCGEIKSAYPQYPLPDKGLLSFFYELEAMPWGPDCIDKVKYVKLYYFENTDKLRNTELPPDLKEEYHIPQYPLEFMSSRSYPDFHDFIKNGGYGFSKENVRRFDEFIDRKRNKAPDNSQYDLSTMFAYPMSIQNDVFDEFENQYVKIKNIPEFELERMAKRPLHESWCLLLQLDSCIFDDIGASHIMFGDAGIVYFGIRKNDLEYRDFSKTWFTLQCC